MAPEAKVIDTSTGEVRKDRQTGETVYSVGVVTIRGRDSSVIQVALVVRGEPLRMVVPRRVGLRVWRCGLAVTVRLHPSQVPADRERAAEGFAHAWRVHAVRVVSLRPGFVRLTAVGFDPLRYPRPTRTRVGSLYGLLRELQYLHATWLGFCPLCHALVPT